MPYTLHQPQSRHSDPSAAWAASGVTAGIDKPGMTATIFVSAQRSRARWVRLAQRFVARFVGFFAANTAVIAIDSAGASNVGGMAVSDRRPLASLSESQACANNQRFRKSALSRVLKKVLRTVHQHFAHLTTLLTHELSHLKLVA